MSITGSSSGEIGYDADVEPAPRPLGRCSRASDGDQVEAGRRLRTACMRARCVGSRPRIRGMSSCR